MASKKGGRLNLFLKKELIDLTNMSSYIWNKTAGRKM
jgi:hypothetical protein